MPDTQPIYNFYASFNSLPELIGGLALSLADAQRKSDEEYVKCLVELAAVLGSTVKASPEGAAAPVLKDLLQAFLPRRYQISQTEFEIRADLRMAVQSEAAVQAGGDLRAGIFALSIGASAARRYGYDYQAAARIRAVFQATPAEPEIVRALLDRLERSPAPTVNAENRYNAFGEALASLANPAAVSGAQPQPDNGGKRDSRS